LTKLFEDSETPVGIRLEALKVMRKAEAKKVTQLPGTSEPIAD
jgi:hypothetical protein